MNKFAQLIKIDPILKFFRTHRINKTVCAIILILFILLLYLKKNIFLFITILLLPHLFEKIAIKLHSPNTYIRPDRLAVTYLLSNLNPFTLYQVLLQVAGQLYIKFKHRGKYPDSTTYKHTCTYSLPFEGEWFIANGGTTPETSHSWEVLTQRYAYDFIIQDSYLNSFTNYGSRLGDYYCYKKNVLSPADGRVILVNDYIMDYKGVESLSIDWKTLDFRGNFIVIKHAAKEYSFIAHFKKGSITVKKGDYVKRGQVIGLCGNSGHSTEPHIHFHLQEGKSMWFSMGLPVKFSNFTIRSSSPECIEVREDFIEKDHYVSNL